MARKDGDVNVHRDDEILYGDVRSESKEMQDEIERLTSQVSKMDLDFCAYTSPSINRRKKNREGVDW